MTLRPTRHGFRPLHHHGTARSLAGYGVACLAVLFATLVSDRAHRAGLPEYLTLYPVAVAGVSALLGIGHGLFAVLLAILLGRATLVHGADGLFPAGEAGIRLFAVSASTFAAAVLVGLVREQRDRLERTTRALEKQQAELVTMHRELQAAEVRRDEFCRDILLAVSHGKLRLCPPEDLQLEAAELFLDAHLREPSDITHLRHSVAEVAQALGMESERTQDLTVCLGEAATNAIVHAGGGHARVFADGETIWIHVADTGPGIDQNELPRATLVKGYSTRASLGMGFSLMQELADSVRLCTGESGTQLLLEMKLQPPPKDPFDLSRLGIDLDDSWDEVPSV